MPIFLDDEPIELPGADLSSVLSAAAERLAPGGRMVVQVEIDGQAVSGEELSERMRQPVGRAELKLTSAGKRELAVEALTQVQLQLARCRQTQIDAAELFQKDEPSAAMKKVAEAVGCWQQTQQATIQVSGLLKLNLDERRIDGEPVKKIIDDLLEQLKGLHDLVTRSDTLALADALAYEWPETADRWSRLAGQMIVWVRESGPKA